MVAIETHWIGPTNTKGSRYVATANTGNRVVMSCDYSLADTQNHARVAYALKQKLNWGHCGPMIGGHTKKGMAWIFTKNAECI